MRGRAPNGAGRVPVGELEPPELVVCHELLDQRKELSLLKADVCVKQLSRRIQRLSIDDAGRHGNFARCGRLPALARARPPAPLLRRDRRAGRRLTGLVHVFDVCADDGFPLSEVQRSRLVYGALIAARDLLVEFERHIARHFEVTGEVYEWR